MKNGWIKLYRGLLEHGIFQDAQVLQVWMYCLLRATYRETKVTVGRQVVVLQPGQLLYGRKAVSQRLNMGEGKLRGIIEQLERMGCIGVESNHQYSVITVYHWQQYQQETGAAAFPFDCDFLEEPYALADETTDIERARPLEAEPTADQPPALSASGAEEKQNQLAANGQPAENHKQEYNNKINNKKINEKKENHDKIKNKNKIKKLKIKKSSAAVFASSAEQNLSACSEQQVKKEPDKKRRTEQKAQQTMGDGIDFFNAAGELEQQELFPVQPKERAQQWEEAHAADSLQDCPFWMVESSGQESLGVEEIAVLDQLAVNRHGFLCAMEMQPPSQPYSQQDWDQLEQLFLCAQTEELQVLADAEAQMQLAERQKLERARRNFDRLWQCYPRPIGYHQVSDEQKLKLYELGYDAVHQAIFNYYWTVNRKPDRFWMYGSTFFNGAYLKYLPEPEQFLRA